MIKSFANIRRAHNVVDGQISWNPSLRDSSSCVRGTFTRQLEDLHGFHPAVRLFSDFTPATDGDIGLAVLNAYNEFSPGLTEAQRISIYRGLGRGTRTNRRAADTTAADQFRTRVIRWIQAEMSHAQLADIQRVVTPDVLFDLEWFSPQDERRIFGTERDES